MIIKGKVENEMKAAGKIQGITRSTYKDVSINLRDLLLEAIFLFFYKGSLLTNDRASSLSALTNLGFLV